MLKNKKTLALAVIILLGLCGFIWYLMSGTTPQDEDPTQPKGNLVTFDGSELKEVENNQLVWTLRAKSMKLNPQTRELYATDLKAKYYKGDTVMTVTAPRGHMAGDRSTFELAGGVKAVNTEGANFTTDSLVFDNKKHELTSAGAFTLVNKDVTITGDKVKADTVLEKITALGHAKLVKQ